MALWVDFMLLMAFSAVSVKTCYRLYIAPPFDVFLMSFWASLSHPLLVLWMPLGLGGLHEPLLTFAFASFVI